MSRSAKRVEDLEIWQLAHELRLVIYRLTESQVARRDFRFCDQLRDAASSINRNIAEGFGRYRHREFANFLAIARGSVFEVADFTHDGNARGYWSDAEAIEVRRLCDRISAGLVSLIRFLKTHPDP